MVLDRVGGRVDQLGHDGLRFEQAGDTRLLGGPQVLAPAAQDVLAAREQAVEVMHEERNVAVPVEDDRVVVVRLGYAAQDVDAVLLGRDDEAVEEVVVGLAVGPQQELALGADPGDEVERVRQRQARLAHAATQSSPRAIANQLFLLGYRPLAVRGCPIAGRRCPQDGRAC